MYVSDVSPNYLKFALHKRGDFGSYSVDISQDKLSRAQKHAIARALTAIITVNLFNSDPQHSAFTEAFVGLHNLETFRIACPDSDTDLIKEHIFKTYLDADLVDEYVLDDDEDATGLTYQVNRLRSYDALKEAAEQQPPSTDWDNLLEAWRYVHPTAKNRYSKIGVKR